MLRDERNSAGEFSIETGRTAEINLPMDTGANPTAFTISK
jgi:hypothetical protein